MICSLYSYIYIIHILNTLANSHDPSRVLFCGLINIISYQVTGLSTSNGAYVIPIPGSPIFLSILGSRMFINLKEAGGANLKVGSGIPARWNPKSTISNLQFAAPHGPQPGRHPHITIKLISE